MLVPRRDIGTPTGNTDSIAGQVHAEMVLGIIHSHSKVGPVPNPIMSFKDHGKEVSHPSRGSSRYTQPMPADGKSLTLICSKPLHVFVSHRRSIFVRDFVPTLSPRILLYDTRILFIIIDWSQGSASRSYTTRIPEMVGNFQLGPQEQKTKP